MRDKIPLRDEHGPGTGSDYDDLIGMLWMIVALLVWILAVLGLARLLGWI